MEQKDNKPVIAAIIAVLVLIGGGLGIYALTQNDDEDTTVETTQVEQAPAEVEEEAVVEGQTIVALAVATPDLSTLVAAVQAAELVDTLSGEGPFTVLAPTNDAFAALPEGTVDTLLLPENIADLQGVLTYHVIAGNVLSSDLSDGQVVETVNGGTLTVDITDTGVYFVDANGGRALVTTADVEASNGTVHIIDAVLLP
jgi:uncharacterized surface protein with fasciclin (FAS1) repeats